MIHQLDATISALLAAKQQVSQLKQQFEASDERWTDADDAEMGMAWVVRRLTRLRHATAVSFHRDPGAETDVR